MLSRAELEAIIARDLPDHELVSIDSGGFAADVDAGGEDIAALRARFLGRRSAAAAPRAAAARNEHDLIVAVRPKRQGAQAKAVIVSGREKRVIGSQG